jgi:methyl-accepting chemotaxis protein
MGEIVASVKQVSRIIGEISAAAAAQSEGILKVNEAVTQLDVATRQNADLVHASTTATDSLQQQADTLAEVVGRFRVAG